MSRALGCRNKKALARPDEGAVMRQQNGNEGGPPQRQRHGPVLKKLARGLDQGDARARQRRHRGVVMRRQRRHAGPTMATRGPDKGDEQPGSWINKGGARVG